MRRTARAVSLTILLAATALAMGGRTQEAASPLRIEPVDGLAIERAVEAAAAVAQDLYRNVAPPRSRQSLRCRQSPQRPVSVRQP